MEVILNVKDDIHDLKKQSHTLHCTQPTKYAKLCPFGKQYRPICTSGKVMGSRASNMLSTSSTNQARRRQSYASSRGKVIRKVSPSHAHDAEERKLLGRI